MPPVTALLLCAGQGQRMAGRCKGLLTLESSALVCRHVRALMAAGVSSIHVVTGHQHELIEEVLSGWPVTMVHNPSWSQGQLSSVLHGLDRLPGGHEALITLVDLPWLAEPHYQASLRAWNQRTDGVRAMASMYRGQAGHPVVIDATVVAACLGQGVSPRTWMTHNPSDSWAWEVDDPAHIRDVDTPAEWTACVRHWPNYPCGDT